MAESAGVALAVLPLFNDAVAVLRHVRTGRNMGEDFEILQIKLELAGLKLSRWGEAAGLSSAEPSQKTLTTEYEETATNALNKIVQLFQQADQKADKKAVHPFESDASNGTKALREAFGNLRISRENKKCKLNVPNQVAWALHMREEFDRLIRDVNELVNGLVDAFSSDTMERPYRELCDVESNELTQDNQHAATLLTDAVENSDADFKNALQKIPQSTPTSVTHNTANFSGENSGGSGQNYGHINASFGKR